MPVPAGFLHHQELVASGLMPQYKCEFCDYEVDPKSPSVYHMIMGWAKGSTQNVKYVEMNYHRYAHEFCMPRNAGADQPSLF